MVKVFSLKLDNALNEYCYQYLINKTSEDKKRKVIAFYQKDDAYRSLFADFLARYVIIEFSDLKNEQISFLHTTYGKPLLETQHNFYFNISHSGDWIVCAVDNAPVGIDVEYIAPIELDISQYFSIHEREDLLSQKKEMQPFYFYELWTLKESYIKQVGMGLSIPLTSFSISILEKDNITLRIGLQTVKTVFFKQYDIDTHYKMAVCAQANSFDDIKQVLLQEIINIF